MPHFIPGKQYHDILRAVERFPMGVSVSALMRMPELGLPKRTLQRRLDFLWNEGNLRVSGQARSRRYLSLASVEASSPVLREEPARYAAKLDWLSMEGRQIRLAVLQPQAQRGAVGYQCGFLNGYVPNVTFYLPQELRRNLAEIGQAGLSDLPAGTYLRQLMDRLLIDLSWNSSRLEGNTYSLLETQRLLEVGLGVTEKGTAETQMILNHKAAIEMLAEQADEIGFNRYTICNLHALLADNLLANPHAAGRIRSRPVGISGTVYHPLAVPQKIEECFERMLVTAEEIEDPFEQAFFMMVHLPYLQPFEDANKRVSRLAANIPLIRQNLCPLSFVDVVQADYVGGLIGVYELNRVDYLRDVFVWAYRRSCVRYSAVRESLGEPDPFRLTHRAEIGRVVREVVDGRLDRMSAARHIAAEASRALPAEDRARFIEVVETELVALHEGNIARYRLRPAEFAAWRGAWK
ncbi:MAG: Fic family protein [Luteolibacter sp.]|jgi:fido (protein-threonine AMPylation protein)|nr:Fic family protein [Luteolibacter sp.]